MPLIANSELPSFARLQAEGQEILTPQRARRQDIRELHIGFLNMMPDPAMQATERQFLRLVGSCNRIAQFYVYPFTFAEIKRGVGAREHIKKYYWDLKKLQTAGLDALIISGANPVQDDLTDEVFWQPLTELLSWAKDNVCSVLCSCLASHAVVQQLWNFKRYKLSQKRWGVYSHRLSDAHHPLTAGINTRFDAPHSHLNAVDADQYKQAGLHALTSSEQAEIYLGTSADGLRFVLFQGHPEYDAISLLKEYRREVGRFINQERADYPPPPQNYFHKEILQIAKEYQGRIETIGGGIKSAPEFPEAEMAELIDNTWADTGKAMINNWLGLIYQVAHPLRDKVFMHGVDKDNPLQLHKN